jgi:succinate-acetate transporter protein
MLTAVHQFGLGIQSLRSAPRWLQAILVVIALALVVLAIVGVIPGRVVVLTAGIAVGLIYAIGTNREIHERAAAEREGFDEQP